MINEGYIKYNIDWVNKDLIIDNNIVERINYWRKKFFQLNLIGILPDGISYGNISIRNSANTFFITGTQIGNINNINQNHISLVQECDLETNMVKCTGLIKASSESLSHYSIYNSNSEINAIIHVHNNKLWNKLKNRFLTTSINAEFGTVKLAQEMSILSSGSSSNIIVTVGHQDGVFCYDRNIDKAGNLLMLNI